MTPVPLPIVIAGVTTASNVMVGSIKALYGMAISINDFFDDQIEEMKGKENTTVSQTGRVLEAAKSGFGIGFISPVVVIATGQLILGNPLTAVGVVVTAPLNPIAMTCAAVGAVYYGWNALNDQEKTELLDKLSEGLEIGVELIKSIIRFVIEKTKKFLSADNLDEIKKYISRAADTFGRKLSDVTGTIGDKLSDAGDVIVKKTSEMMDKTSEFLSETIDGIKEHGGKVIDKLNHNKEKNDEKINLEPTVKVEINSTVGAKRKLTSKGQLTIPKEIREALGLSSDSEVELVIDGNNVTLRKAKS